MAWTDLLPQPQAPTPNIGANPNALLQFQLNQLRLNEARQEIAGQNALRQAAGDPSNFANGQFQPTGNALARIFQADPNKGLEIQNAVAGAQTQQTRNSLLAAQVGQAERDEIYGASLPARARYEEIMRTKNDPELAQREAQKVLDESLAPILPTLSEPTRRALGDRPIFNYQQNTMGLLSSPKYRAMFAEERKEKFEGYTAVEEQAPQGGTRRIFVAPGKPALDLAGNPVTPTGTTAKPEEPKFVGTVTKDGKSEADVPLLYGTQGFVDARTHTPIPNDQLKNIRHMGAGSQATPEAIDATAELIANYQQPPLSSYAMKSGNGPAIMRRVQEINPNFSASKYQAAARTRTAFDVGRQGDQVRSLNVAIQHLDVFDDLGKALQNRDTLAVNRVLNYVQTEMGHPEVKNFDTAKQIIGDEVIKSVIGSGAALSDREGLQKQFNSASSPAQLQQVAGTIKRLMAGQLSGLRRQFTAAGLPSDEFNDKLDPDTVKALESDTGRTGAAPGGGNRVTLGNDAAENQRKMATAPGGTIFVFPDGSTLTKPGAPR